MIGAIEDLLVYLITNWRSLTIQGALTAVIVIVIKRIGIQQLKKLLHLKDNSELTEIKQDIKAIKEHLGVLECADSGRSTTSEVTKQNKRLAPFWADNSFVSNVMKFIFWRRKNKMSNKFKSRKFILACVSAILIVLNDGLDLGIDSNTVLAFAGIVATWIIGESAVDAKREGARVNEEHPVDHGPAV
jgi:hypothetical protein